MTGTLEQVSDERWIRINNNFEYLIEDPVKVLERRIEERDRMYGFGDSQIQ